MRIASLSPATTEILFAIGAGRDIVCTDQFSDEPEAARGIPHLKDHQRIHVAALSEHKPELAFTATLVQERLAGELKKAGLCAAVHFDPRSIGDVYEMIRSIGMLLSRDREARGLVQSMQNGLSALQKRAKLLPRKPKVYVEEWHPPPLASGNWVPEVVKLAGGQPFVPSSGQPVSAREGESAHPPSGVVSLSEIAAFNPDIIVLSICGAGKLAEKRLLSEREGWRGLDAVKRNCVFVIDDSLLNRPGQRLVEGAQKLYGWMFEALH